MGEAPKLPLELRSEEGRALCVYSRAPGQVTIETDGEHKISIASHLNYGAAKAVRDALDAWIAQEAVRNA